MERTSQKTETETQTLDEATTAVGRQVSEYTRSPKFRSQSFRRTRALTFILSESDSRKLEEKVKNRDFIPHGGHIFTAFRRCPNKPTSLGGEKVFVVVSTTKDGVTDTRVDAMVKTLCSSVSKPRQHDTSATAPHQARYRRPTGPVIGVSGAVMSPEEALEESREYSHSVKDW